MSQALTLYSNLPSMLPAIVDAGTAFANSGLFGCTKREQGIVLAMECVAQQTTPTQILRRWHIVDGHLNLKAAAALADFRQNGGDHEWHNLGDVSTGSKPEDHYAEATFTDPKGRKLKYRYSMADAAKEELLRKGSRWQKRPGQMLRARVISNALMALCPELYAGTDDEDDTPQAGPTLDLGTAATQTAATASTVLQPTTEVKESAATSKPIDVAATVTPQPDPTPEPKTEPKADQPELAKMGLAPTQPKISDNLVEQVKDAIGAHGPAAVTWMLRNNWLRPGQNLDALSEPQAKKILHAYRAAAGDPSKNKFLNTILQPAK